MEPLPAAARTPPMGWDSRDYYAAAVTRKQRLGNAERMARYLPRAGWHPPPPPQREANVLTRNEKV